MHSLSIVLISYSHKNADIAFRDQIALNSDEIIHFIEVAMIDTKIMKEIAVISTCNRTEFYFVTQAPTQLFPWLVEKYTTIRGVDINRDAPTPLTQYDRDAVMHLMAVAGGLESMMLGENQILIQVKSSYKLNLSSSYKFPILNRLFQDAIRAGKSIRTKTALCQGAVSISMAAVELARKIYSSFSKRNVLIIGAGETAELVALHFHRLGVNHFIIANRDKKRRENLASKYDAQPISLERIPDALQEADIVVTATKSPTYLITNDIIATVLKSRNQRSILIIDISSPRNVEPEIADIPEVFLYNISDLRQVVIESLEKRNKEIPAAEAIVKEVAEEFMDWYRALEVVPTISKLAGYFDHIRTQELGKYIHKASEKEYQHLDELSRSIVRKLLHYPISELRKQNHKGDLSVTKIDALWDLFHLREFDKKPE